MTTEAATDLIEYTEPFKAHVQGQLKARFRLDSARVPQYEPDDDDNRLRHYTIDVFLATPIADQIKKVIYLIDDPTFVDPKGYSSDASNEFREEIVTYGDVEIIVTVVKKDGHQYEQRAWLSNMLENGHASKMNGDIQAAIKRIKAY